MLKAYDDIEFKVSFGECLLYRTYDWNRQERDEMKKEKVVRWYTQGGYELVIFVLSTLGSVLQRGYQEEIP